MMHSNNERGMALILVLTLAAAIGGLCAAMLTGLKQTALSAHAGEQWLVRRIAADSAIELAAHHLRDSGATPNAVMEFEIGDTKIKVGITPAGNGFDVNAATPEQLEAWIGGILPDEPEMALELAHKITDWRDPEDLRQLQGAEANEYRRAGLDYGPANGPLRHVNELRDILEMPDDIFQKLADKATISTGRAVVEQQNETSEPDQTVDEESETTEQPAETDAQNVYKLSVETKSATGGSLLTQAIILIEPPDNNRVYEILDYQPFARKAPAQ